MRTIIIVSMCWTGIGQARIPDTFYDAERSYFSKDGKHQIFSGNAVVISSGFMLAADRITVDHQEEVLEARGRVLIASDDKVMTAKSVRYWLASRDFVITAATVVIADRQKSAQVIAEIILRGDKQGMRAKKRRQFWLRTRGQAVTRGKNFYVRLKGDRVERHSLKNITIDTVTLTPCRCADGKPPAWGLRARRVTAKLDDYADIENAVVEVRGIPVLFLPWLRVPLRRKSGLLLPTFGRRKQTGFSVSQPLYFTFSPASDVTLYLDWLEKRGFRLATNTRLKLTPLTGWEITAEGLPDRNDTDRNWRGTVKWRGLTFLTPRLSLLSVGDISSDRRYNTELYQPRDKQPDFATTPSAQNRLWLHMGAENYYLGAGGHAVNRAAIQLPFNLTFQSRYLTLLDTPLLKTHAKLALDQKWSNGLHHHGKLQAVSSLVATKIISVAQFWEMDIKRSHMNTTTNSLHTWRTGLDFALPLDGRMQLAEQGHYLQHLLRLHAGFSVRPYVSSDWQTDYFAAEQLSPSQVVDLSLEQSWRIVTPETREEPVRTRLHVSYDRWQARLRAKQRREGTAELAEPWSELEFNLHLKTGSLVLQNDFSYHFYRRLFTAMAFTLQLPVVSGLHLFPAWSITSGLDVDRIETRQLGITAEVNRTSLFLEYADQVTRPRREAKRYRWQVGGEYRSPSRCWGLKFSRLKDYDDRELDASWMLSLLINFGIDESS